MPEGDILNAISSLHVDLSEIKDAVTETRILVKVMNGKVTDHEARLRRSEEELLTHRHKTLEHDIDGVGQIARANEKQKWIWVGALSVLAFAAGYLVPQLF